MSQISRRNFFKHIAAITGAAIIAPALVRLNAARAEERRRGGGEAAKTAGPLALPLAIPGQGTAAGVNYVEDKKKMSKAELKTDHQGVKWDAQHCNGCTFYKSAGKKDGKEVGTCTVLAGNLVVAQAWCSSWTKKA